MRNLCMKMQKEVSGEKEKDKVEYWGRERARAITNDARMMHFSHQWFNFYFLEVRIFIWFDLY